MSQTTSLHRRSFLLTGTAAAASAMLAACGGGGGSEGTAGDNPPVASDGTSYTQGPISGFGSVFVGGVRFDDSLAVCTDEDGNARDRSALKLGTTVEIDGGLVNRTLASALALRIRLGSEIVGPLGTVDLAASTAVVLGQAVLVTSSTVFDDTLAGGLTALAALPAGSVLQVYGMLDPANARVVATRIEAEAGATAYKLRGRIANLDATLATFTINGVLVSYAGLGAAQVPAGLANGQLVRVLLQTTPLLGAWVATALRGGLRLPTSPHEAHVEGVITSFTSLSAFAVNGLAVDASGASFPDGSAGVVLGARVEVDGSVSNGVLVASKVTLEERRTLGRRPFELRGELGRLNTTDKTFALRGVTVWYGGTVTYGNGSEATLANGVRVEVRGVLASDRTRLEAQRISFT